MDVQSHISYSVRMQSGDVRASGQGVGSSRGEVKVVGSSMGVVNRSAWIE